jgi:hypothetical protein
MFVALVIQHGMCMHHTAISGPSGSTVFFTLSQKRHDFRKKVTEYKNVCCDLIYVYNFCLKQFSFSEEISKIGLHVKYRYSCQILMKLECSRQIFEKYQVSIFMKMRLIRSDMFHAYGET